MPTWSSIKAYQREIDQLGRRLNQDLVAATREMAENAERVWSATARPDLGGDMQFSGWSSRHLDDLRIKRGRGANSMSHWLFPTRKSGGPIKVLDQGRNRGDVRGRGGVEIFIGPSIDRSSGETFRTKTGKVRMTRTRRSSKWSGYTSGKGTVDRAVSKFDKDAERIADKRFRTALSKHFDVT